MAVARRGTQLARSASTAAVGSITVTFPGAATAGDFIAVSVSLDTNRVPSTTGVTDNQTGNTYTRDVIGSAVSASGDTVGIYSAPNINASGTFTITYTGTSSFMTVAISEYSGIRTSGYLDVTAAGGSNVANTTQTTAATLTTTFADAVAIAAQSNDSGVATTFNTSAPFSTVSLESGGVTKLCGGMSDQILSATGTQQCTWTGPSVKWDACIAVYKGLASAPSFVPYQPLYQSAPVMAQ